MLLVLRQRLEYLGILVIEAFVRLFPLDTAASISAFGWKAIAPRTHRHARALSNLAMAFPDKTPREREAIALAMWDNLGRVMAETLQLDRLLADPSRVTFENEDLIRIYDGKIGAGIFSSLHMGNWELTILAAHAVGARPAAVYRIVENPYVDRFLRSKREKLYPGGLFARGGKDGQNTARMLAQCLKGGGTLGILADLVDWKGVQVPFFGHPMWATPAPAWLARRLGVRLWAGRCVRSGTGSRFKIAFKEIKVTRTGNIDDDILSITAALQSQFEDWIMEYPEQWMWSNKRWPNMEARQKAWELQAAAEKRLAEAG